MPRRYYFAPVTGESALSGVARGLEAGVENFERGRMRAREVRRQEKQDRRQDLFDELEVDDYLRSRGGGRGEAPTTNVPIRDYGGRREPFQAPEFMPPRPEWEPPDDWMSAAPEFQPKEYSVPRPDSRYQPVGPQGFGYAMTPDAVEEEEYLRGQDRAAAERSGVIARMGPAASALASGRIGRDDPGFGRAAVGMLADDFDPFAFMPPADDEAYSPTTRDDYFLARGRDPATGRSLDPPRAADRTTPTYAQAVDALIDMFPGEFAGETSLSPSELHMRATRMSSGEDPFPEERGPGRRPDPGAMAGYPRSSIDRAMRNYRRRGPIRPADEAEAAPAVAAPAAPTDDEVGAALEELDGLTEAQQVSILVAEGATAEQIRRVRTGG